MNTHSETSLTPLVRSVIGDALLKAMPVMSFRPHCEFFLGRPAAEFLCKFRSSVGSDLGVGATCLIK